MIFISEYYQHFCGGRRPALCSSVIKSLCVFSPELGPYIIDYVHDGVALEQKATDKSLDATIKSLLLSSLTPK